MIESILSTHQFNGDDYDAMRSAVRVDASAVSRLFFSYELEQWSARDFSEIFSAIVPPFPNLWIEFEAPSTAAIDGGEIVKWPYDTAPSMWGAMVRTYEAKLYELVGGFDNLQFQTGNGEEFWATDAELTKWCIVVDIYQKFSGCDPTHWFRRIYAISEDGRLVMSPSGGVNFCFSDFSRDSFDLRIQSGMLVMIFLAISFMHCRNVSLVNKPVNEREARLFVKKHGRPMVQFKTLVIDHMKRILRNSEQGSGKSLKRALHRCRGHFVHYSEARPLFGKYPGKFWVPSHFRGDETMGTVEKNYLVR